MELYVRELTCQGDKKVKSEKSEVKALRFTFHLSLIYRYVADAHSAFASSLFMFSINPSTSGLAT
jgi:hypothetical protein